MRNLLIRNNHIFNLLINKSKNFSTLTRENMDLKLVVKRLEEYAPLSNACDWDNVGLLVEPSSESNVPIKKILITNDLTEPVLEEAIKKNANMIISYHPPIFQPLKRLTQSEWKQRAIVKCIEKQIAVYSPHTCWDSVEGGINDWILRAFDTKKVEPVQPIKSATHPSGFSKGVKVNLSFGPSKDKLLSRVSALNDCVRFVGEKQIVGQESLKLVELEFLTSPNGVVKLIDFIKEINDPSLMESLRINEYEKPLMKSVGNGRLGYLNEPTKIKHIVSKLKEHLNMKSFRLALANGKSLEDTVKTIAVGAGSGSKLLNNLKADMIVTGEFSHHEILHEVHRGVCVIVTDHSNTERGHHLYFKSAFSRFLKEKYNESVELVVSEIDRDPLEYI